MKSLLLTVSFSTLILIAGCNAGPDAIKPAPHHSGPTMQPINNVVPPTTEAPSSDADFDALIQKLRQRNAALEASQAVARGERFLYGWYAGRGGLRIPGANSGQANCQIRALDGLGDVIYGQNHLKYRVEMRRFATTFNAAMLPSCQ